MFRFGKASREALCGCHPILAEIAEAALATGIMDFSVSYGFRGEAEQNAAHKTGNSDKPWPKSKHNHMEGGRPCSLAMDLLPYPFKLEYWQKPLPFYFLAGVVMTAAQPVLAKYPGVKLVWGGDWDSDRDFFDHRLVDCPHFELHFSGNAKP